jgi:hypothetical protein
LRLIRADVFGILCAALLTIIAAAGVAHAGAVRDIVAVDFVTEIDKVIGTPERFAIDVPYNAGVLTHGTWTVTGTTSTWRWEVQVPGAVSLSFHAGRAMLPAGAQLSVTGGGAEYSYGPASVHRGELWSRIAHGDTLTFTLTVQTADAGAVALDIVGLQAGYRSLGGKGPNHPHYDELLGRPQSSGATTSCVENFQCNVTSGDLGPGQASVMLVIENTFLCSGVLLNDVPGDGTPYVLTARHCENGSSDGGDPGAASGITAYFDFTTPCGQALETIYNAYAAATSGAVTLVEQQDAWLVRLDGAVPVTDAYFAGWDATGADFVGGYTAHYALGFTRQYTEWFGQAYFATVPAATLGVGYTSTFWELVNQAGSIAPGASGSGVFDGSNLFVGTIVRGEVQGTGPNAPGVCPMPSPPVPGPTTATAEATALSGIFDSTADPESTTGSVTLRTVLDPQNSGTLSLGGRWMPLQFAASSSSATIGSLVTLTWNAEGATSCSASGGQAGDGWRGTLGVIGNVQGTEHTAGAVTYTLTCIFGTRQSSASVTVTWSLAPPAVTLQSSAAYNNDVNYPVQLTWSSNVTPCTAAGGGTGDGWAGAIAQTGTKNVTESQAGTYTYAISCGSGSQTASANIQITYVVISASLQDGGITSANIGVPVPVTGGSAAAKYCVTSGGAAGDGWAGVEFMEAISYAVSESVPGTYTYTISCYSYHGSAVATASVTIMFINGPPSVTINVTPESPIVGTSVVEVTWEASVQPCTYSVSGYRNYSQGNYGYFGTVADGEPVIGSYVYTVTCSGVSTASASKTIYWGGTPQLTFAPENSPLVQGSPGEALVWSGNVAPCVASGGEPGDGWTGVSLPASSSYWPVSESAAGTYSYKLTCGTGSATAQAQTSLTIDPGPVFATLTASTTTSPESGTPVTLTWNSNTTPCYHAGSYGNGGWGTNDVASSGSASVGERNAGPATYVLQCGSGTTTSASAQVTVNYTGPPAPSLTTSDRELEVGQPFTLAWASADGSACIGSWGSPGDGWAGPHPASGSMELVELIPASEVFELTCGISPTAIVDVDVDGQYNVPAAVLPNYAAGELTIPSLVIGYADYSNVVVPVSRIISGPTGTLPSGGVPSYDPASGQLTIPQVMFDSIKYYNVVAAAGSPVSIGGVSGADTYNPASNQLTIASVQVAGGSTYNNVVITVGSIISVGSGMPIAANDQYQRATNQLLIPAVQVGDKVYTNVVITAGAILSVGLL